MNFRALEFQARNQWGHRCKHFLHCQWNVLFFIFFFTPPRITVEPGFFVVVGFFLHCVHVNVSNNKDLQQRKQ